MTSNLTTDESSFSRSRLIHVKRSANIFWKRWIKEYLPTIVPRTKWLKEKRNLKPGDVVLLIQESTYRNVWPICVVTDTFPDKQGHVRTVMCRTGSTTVRRPISKLCLFVPSEEHCALKDS